MAATLATASECDTALAAFIRRHPRLLVLTGAGCSVASGIPEYRDHEGAWKSRPPVRYAEFVGSAAVRRRYWARSVFGWARVAGAAPGAVHRALARLENAGYTRAVVTQNVDARHQRAGSRRVIDLHGRLDEVECLQCGTRLGRADLQEVLLSWNAPFLAALGGVASAGEAARPDGGRRAATRSWRYHGSKPPDPRWQRESPPAGGWRRRANRRARRRRARWGGHSYRCRIRRRRLKRGQRL